MYLVFARIHSLPTHASAALNHAFCSSTTLRSWLVDHGTYLQETLLVRGHMIQRNVSIICLLANQHRMSLAKGSSANILST